MKFVIAILTVLQLVAEARILESSSSSQSERGDVVVGEIVGAESSFHNEEAHHVRRPAATAPAKSRDVHQQYLKPLEGYSIFGERFVGGKDEKQALQLTRGCPSNQKSWYFELTTDNNGVYNSWELKKGGASPQSTHSLVGGSNVIDISASARALNDVIVVAGPPSGHVYENNKEYTGSMCLDEGWYTLLVRDTFGDGMCCTAGKGGYSSTVEGVLVAASPSGDDKDEDWTEREHIFYIGEKSPTKRETPGGCINITIQLKVDKYGEETSYKLVQVDTGSVELSSLKEVPANEMQEKSVCLTPGDYKFTIEDDAHDGICCMNGDGYYRIVVDGQEILKVGKGFRALATHIVKLGYEPVMDGRDAAWLIAHNDARLGWYTNNGNLALYTPIQWSTTLATDAQKWAESVLEVDGCPAVENLPKEPNLEEGQNMAGNDQREADPNNVVGNQWVNIVENRDYPGNGVLTQVMWRSTRYVGCGEAQKDMGNGKTCYRQVCRYVRPGNCAMNQGDWMDLVLQEQSYCGEPCPMEGCYAQINN